MEKFIKLSFLILFSLMGCSNESIFEGISDESSGSSSIADAAIALDEQDYDGAISLLADVYDTTYPDPEASRIIASAYMGKAGIDVTNLITYSAGENDAAFDMVANTLNLYPVQFACDVQSLSVLMTSSGAQYIDGKCISNIITYLNKAKRALYLSLNANGVNSNDIIQYGILSAFHFAVSMGNTVSLALDPTYKPDDENWDPSSYVPGIVPISKEAYHQLRYGAPWRKTYFWMMLDPSDFARGTGTESINLYQDDLINIKNAIEAFGLPASETNNVRDPLDAFLRDALQNPIDEITDSIIISTMTTSGIVYYINVLSSVGL